ncbi:MAG TPA: DUF1415 family protein [Polyangiaceae bacterium]|nr:DUF1415 family protein [Polyangiaceae bacterium]
MTPAQEEALRAEALRVYRRYQREIVEGLNLCPWAAQARRAGNVREVVLLGDSLDTAAPLAALSDLAGDASVEIGLLLFPRVAASAPEFERYVSALSRTDQERRPLGTAPFALAAFHPESPADPSDPERLIPFLRRSPDPTIQVVRLAALDRVREGFNEGTAFVDVTQLMARGLTADDTLSLRERIARANAKTVSELGVPHVTTLLDAIRRDRDAAYARILGAT